jgi:hypothetical protein
MSQIIEKMTEEQKKAFAKWLLWRGRQYILEMQEAKNKEAKEKEHARFFRRLAGDYSNDDDDDAEEDEETRIAQAWQLVKMEAETLTLDYIEIYGGEKFKSFIAQDISVLHQHYPRLLLDAQTTVDNENKRKEQKKRKLEESAGGSAAGGSAAGGSAAGGSAAGGSATGGSAGVDAMETALLQARPGPCPRMMSLMYQKQIERLVKQIQDQSQVYEQAIRFANIRKQDMNTERWLALDKCERTESKNAELHKEISELKVEIAKLKGKRLDLPPRELDELLDVVKETIRKISDQKNLQEVKEKMEGENIFCCSLSGGLFEFPVLALDGYTYEKEKIEQWIEVQLDKNEVYVDRRGKWLSPKTGVLLPSTLLVPNFDIKSLMEEEIHKRLVEMRAKEVSR